MPLRNPFYNIGPITEPGLFFNRKVVTDTVLNNVLSQKPTCRSIVGQRKIGKSSLLRHVSHQAVTQQYAFPSEFCLWLPLDCQRDPHVLRGYDAFYQWMLERLIHQIQYRLPAPTSMANLLRETSAAAGRWDDALEQLSELGYRVVAVFDEFEKAIAQETLIAGGLFGSLRARASGSSNFAWITLTTRPLHVLFEEAFEAFNIPRLRRKSESDFFNLAPVDIVGLFHEPDIESMITIPLGGTGGDFTPSDVESIIRFGGRFPYFVQRACFYVCNAYLSSTTSRESMIEQCSKESMPIWEDFWRKLDASQQTALHLAAGGADLSGDSLDIEMLKDLALLYEDDNGKLCPFSDEFGRFVRSRSLPDAAASCIKPGRRRTKTAQAVSSGRTRDRYVDFAISVDLSGRLVARSAEGEQVSNVSLDLPNDVTSTMQLIERNHVTEELLLNFGRHLYGLVFPREILAHFDQTEAVARSRSERIRIRLSIEPDSLARLPWEFTFREEGHYYLSTNPKTVLSRYLNLPVPPNRARRRQGPLHMLVIIANPIDQPLDASEWERIAQTALSIPLSDNTITTTTIKHATFETITDELLRQKPDIVQFVGHGMYRNGKGYLALVDSSTQSSWWINDVQFANLFLAGDDHLGLICLATCESAKSDSPQGFVGIAPRLVERGVPAVVAMQYRIRESTAKTFFANFYTAVAHRNPLDWAVQWGRNAISIKTTPDSPEFATPVLFMRSPNGQVF